MSSPLILFDLDQTLLDTGGAGTDAFYRTIARLVRPVILPPGYTMAGKTDTGIIAELLTMIGVRQDQLEPTLHEVLDLYPDVLADLIRSYQVAANPGVVDLLSALEAEPDVTLGIYTGNIIRGAQIKLRSAGLDRFAYRVWACGDGARDKIEVLTQGLAQACQLLGTAYDPNNTVVVGDAPGDILGGQALGVRTAAVATGPYSLAELAAFSPDCLLPDLADWRQARETLLNLTRYDKIRL